jgi:hypothetical protein
LSDESKFYSSGDPGLSAFIWYVTAGEETFVRVDLGGNRPVVLFRDNINTAPCSELAQMYHAGAQLSNVKEYANCYRLVGNEIRAAYRASKIK